MKNDKKLTVEVHREEAEADDVEQEDGRGRVRVRAPETMDLSQDLASHASDEDEPRNHLVYREHRVPVTGGGSNSGRRRTVQGHEADDQL